MISLGETIMSKALRLIARFPLVESVEVRLYRQPNNKGNNGTLAERSIFTPLTRLVAPYTYGATNLTELEFIFLTELI